MWLPKLLARGLAVALFSFFSGCVFADLVIEGMVTAAGETAANAEVKLVPIPGAADRGKLYLEGSVSPEPVALATTDGRGYFRLTAPKVGMWSVRVDAPPHAPAEYGIQPLLDAVELPTLDLEDGAGLSVETCGPDGQPVDARVAVFKFSDTGFFAGLRRPSRRNDAWNPPVFVGRTGENGRLEITVEKDGPYLVEVVAAGFLPAERELREPGTARFELRTGRERTVRAVDEAGKAVAGVLVYEAEATLPTTATGDDGRATVLQGDDALRLRLAGPDHRRGDVTLEAAGDPAATPEEVTVTLVEPPRFTGRVIDRETRRPIGGALVWPAGSSGDFVSTDGSGVYTLAAESEWNSAWAAAAGYAPATESLRERASGEGTRQAPTLALTPASVISGRVVDGDGNALAGVEVVATVKAEMNPARMLRMMRGRSSPQTARSDRRGAFRVAGLPAGQSYELRFRLDGYTEVQQSVENLRAFEERSDLRVVLDRGRHGVGFVVDEDDAPVPGATVRLKPRREGEANRFRRVVVRFGDEAEEDDPGWLTDSRGRFEIPDLAAGKYDLEVEASGFARAAVPGVEVPEDVAEVDLGTVALAPGAEIRGRVTDADGRPLAAAEVRVGEDSGMPSAFMGMMLRRQRPRGRSGANGLFTVGDLKNGEKVNLLVSRAGLVDATVAGVLAPTVEPVEVVMKPASWVLGKVVDEDGRAVEDAQVRVDAEGRRGIGQRGRSRSDGTFVIEDVAPGRVSVAAEAPGFQPYSLSGLEVPDGADLEGVTLTLALGAVIEGTVFAPDGRPVIDASVRAVEPGTSNPFSMGGLNVTDGDGRFWIDGLPLGRRTVIAEHDVYQRVARDVEVEKGVNRIDLVFEGGVDVSGRVIGPDGGPVAGARVTLAGSGRFAFLGATQEATSQADGGFRVVGVQPGQYVLQATKEGFAQASATDPITVGQSPVADLEVRLTTGATLTGEILGLSVDELAKLRIIAASGRDFRAGEADFEGRYQVLNLGVGDWRVSAELAGAGRRASGQVTVTEDDLEVNLDLEFGSGYVLTGTVLVGSRPMAGAMVSASRRGGGNARATTSQDGTFRMEDLEEGAYTLSVYSASFTALRHREEIELTGDDDVLIELVTARVAGWVTNAYDHSPVVGARMRLEPVEDDGEDAVVFVVGGFGNETDSRGYFALADVPEGFWKLIAQRSGFAPAEQVVDVHGDALGELELEMTPTEGLYFEAALAVGGAPTQVNAAVLRTPGSTDDVVISGYGIQTGENGRVRLTEVPPGSFELLVAAAGTVTVATPVVSPGQLGRVVLPIGGILRIKAPELEGAPAKVRLASPSGRPYRHVSFGGRIVSEPSVGRPIEGLEPGTWRFTVTADDGRAWSGEARVEASQTVEVVVP